MTLGVCPLCKGFMRVDTKDLSEDIPFKVRCPHCGVVLAVEAPTVGNIQDISDNDESKDAFPKPGDAEYTPENTAADQAPALNWAEEPDIWEEEEIPESALFPAEKDAGTTVGTWMKSSLRTLLWIVISIGVIAVFALIVNLVLPGPAGERGISSFKAPSMEQINKESVK